jgi:hypothetical protein
MIFKDKNKNWLFQRWVEKVIEKLTFNKILVIDWNVCFVIAFYLIFSDQKKNFENVLSKFLVLILNFNKIIFFSVCLHECTKQ